MARAGQAPEVVLEATYGWYWAADALAAMGAQVHLAHPLGVKAFEYRRVKNDERDAADLADLLRMGRLPEAWIAPPATRELRELVRHRAKLVGLRSSVKCQVHAVLAKAGVQVPMSDLFGVAGCELLDRLALPAPSRARINSAAPGHRAARVRDRHVHPPGRGPARRRPGLPGGADAARRRPGAGCGVRRRDRRRVPVPESAPAGQLGRTDPQASRVGRQGAPRPDHQAGQPAGPLGRGRGGADGAEGHPRSVRSGTGSRPAAAATSASSPPPGELVELSSTRCATGTYALGATAAAA